MKQILERIAKSLEAIADDSKARKEMQMEVLKRTENMERALEELKNNPLLSSIESREMG